MQTTGEDARIKLTFESFSLEAHESGACIYDYVEVSFDSFSWKFCGRNAPGPFLTSGPSMTVRFHSDNLGAETGFLAKWEEINVNGNRTHLALAIFLNPTYHIILYHIVI